jgi:uncharacterized protein GlcG (DUF336 family)
VCQSSLILRRGYLDKNVNNEETYRPLCSTWAALHDAVLTLGGGVPLGTQYRQLLFALGLSPRAAIFDSALECENIPYSPRSLLRLSVVPLVRG